MGMNKTISQPYTFKARDPYGSHYTIANLIKEFGFKKVLDVGCNYGFIGRALNDFNWDGDIVGIDIDPDMKSIVGENHYIRFKKIDLETDLKKVKGKYDVVVFGDVLISIPPP